MKKFFVGFAIVAFIFTLGVTFLDSRPSEEQCREICLDNNPRLTPTELMICICNCSGTPYPYE